MNNPNPTQKKVVKEIETINTNFYEEQVGKDDSYWNFRLTILIAEKMNQIIKKLKL